MKCICNYFSRVCHTASAILIMLVGTGSYSSAQTTSSDLSFEVATIKPVLRDGDHLFNPEHFWAHVYPARSSYWSMTLTNLIEYAYHVPSYQVTGPGWIKADQFDIEARFPKGATKDDEKKMLQALLKDRFKLSFRIEKRDVETYSLVTGKHGAKLKPALPDSMQSGTDTSSKQGERSERGGDTKPKLTRNPDGSSTIDLGGRGTQTIKLDAENWANHFERSKITMEEFASSLSTCFGKGVSKVYDQTGIKGSFQVAWDCPLIGIRSTKSGDADDAVPSDPQGGGSLSRSLDALGLKIEKRKTPMDVYVIDHAEKPSED